MEFDHYEVKELDGTEEVEEAEEITLVSTQYQVNYDQKTLTVINTNIDDVELEVIKIWQQPAGVDLPVDGALITLKGNSGVFVRITDNNQMAHVLGLFPKYENGVKVDYQVEEELAGYQSAINKKENGNTITFTVTNAKLQTEDERYRVTKTWVGDAAGSVTFGMYEVTADGKLKQVDTLTLTAADAQPGNTQVWEGKFAAQVAYDKNGEPIRYTVKELDENGNPVEDGKIVSLGGVPYKVKDDSVAEQKYFAFTNTQQTSITVTKTWRGLPQNAAYFGLFQEGSEQRKDKITLTAEDGWKGEFKDIQFKDPAGNQIVYVVRELDKDGNILEEGENTSVRLGNTKYRITRDGYAFTNTELIDLEIAKEWSATIPEGARRSVGIELRANGEVKEKFVLNKENNWTKQFNDLPRWDGTELVTYQVVEVSINGEEITLPQTLGYDYVHKIFKIHLSDGALAITNTSSINVTNAVDEVTQPDDPNKRNIQVVKFWGTTPAEHQKPVVVKLYKLDENGKLVPVDGGEQILSAENNWQAMFANLPRYQERTVKLETLEIKDDVLPQGAPKVEPAKPEEQPNAEQPQSEEQEAAPAEQPAQPSEETTQPTEPQVQPSEQPSAAPAEENQPAETPAAEAETPQTEQENSVPAANGGIAPETPAAENEEQPAETPVEQGQTEQAEQPQQSEAPAEQEQPAAQLQAQAEQIQYFVFEVKVGEEAAGVEPRIGLNDYHIGDYHVEIVDNGKDRVWIFNTHKGAIPEEEQTSVTVTKYWGNTPTDYRQPVQVRLYVDESGDVHPADIEARTLSAANNWTTTFSGLKKTAQYLVFETQIDGQNIDFNVNEKPATYRHGRYIVTISSNGTANVTITNDYELDPLPPYNPDPTPDTPNPYDPTPNNPTTPTTPTTPATNDDNNTINDEPTPESAPAEVPINDPAIPESAPVVEEEGIKEEVLPQGAPELPKTGGMGAGFFGLLGMGLAGLGMLLKKKK